MENNSSNNCTSCGSATPNPNCHYCRDNSFTKNVIEIDNPENLVLFKKVVMPASLGDETTNPPYPGKYCNVLMVYEANGHAYLYSSDGIPTALGFDTGGILVVDEFPEVEQAATNFLYIKKDDGDAKITTDNENWTIINEPGGKVLIVDSLPDPSEARTNALYITTNGQAQIVENGQWVLVGSGGGGGGTGDFNQLINRPKYAGKQMDSSTDIPDVEALFNSLSLSFDHKIDKVVMTDLSVATNPSTTTVHLDAAKENILTGAHTTKSLALPVAGPHQAGVINTATYNTILQNTEDIEAILGGAVAVNGMPDPVTQEQITDAWKNATGQTELINHATVYDVANNKVWTYYANEDTWYSASNTAQINIDKFTNTSEGTIKGSLIDGQVFAETDGTGSVNGWDNLSAQVSDNKDNIAAIQTAVDGKQDKLTAGNAITIEEDGTTSAWIYPERFFLDDEYTEGEGTSFEMRDTAYLQVRRIEMRGDTYQNDYEGVNILHVPYTGTIEGSGVWRWTIDSGNEITFSNVGATTVNTKLYLYKRDVDSFDMPAVAAGQYLLASFNSGEQYASKIVVETTSGTFEANSANNWKVSFPSNVTINNIYITPVTNWSSSSSFNLDAKMVPVAQASLEEPYTGKLPAPSPDYPQPVQVTTGTQGFSIAGSNLYNVEDITNPWPDASQVFVDEEGFIHIEYDNTSGTVTRNPRFWTNNLGLNPDTEYSIVAEIKSASISGGSRASSLQIVLNSQTTTFNGQFTQNWQPRVTELENNVGKTLIVQRTTRSSFNLPGTGLSTVLNLRAGEKASVVFRLSVLRDTSITPDKFIYRKYEGQSGTVNLGKNLFDKDNMQILDGYYFTGAKSAINNTGTLSSRSAIVYIPCYPYTNYSISGYSNIGFDSVIASTTKEVPNVGVSTTRLATNNTSVINGFSTPEDSNFLAICFRVPNGQTIASKIPQLLESLQIERGPNSTEYSPYFEPIELLKLGSNQDRIYRSGTSYFLVKTTDSLVLDGTETGWQYDAATNTVKLPTPADWTGSDYLCTHFKKGTPATTNNTFSIDSSYITFRADGITDSIATWTTWLNQRGVTVYSQIQTPVETEIVNPLVKSGLANMYNCHTYPDLSSISSSSNGDLMANLYVEAFKNSLEGITGAIRNIPICC